MKSRASISSDLHKFGFTPHGISSVTFRSMEFASHATFAFDAWPCGLYAADAFQGSRAGQTTVAAWTTMRLLGREGYLDVVRRML